MLNNFTPYPTYEKAIFVGDKACEYLAALKIYAYGLIGGDVPSMELLHPQEKPLECVACAMHNKPKILKAAIDKLPADYVLLEDNHREELNPATMKDKLESEGVDVKILDVEGSVPEVLRRAGALYRCEKHAERVISDYETRFEEVAKFKNEIAAGQRLLILLGIRQPVTLDTYLFAVTSSSQLTQTLQKHYGIVNAVETDPEKEMIPGIVEVEDMKKLLALKPDAIALCGDALCCAKAVENACKADPQLRAIKAIEEQKLWPLPYYCEALAWREPQILQVWGQALK